MVFYNQMNLLKDVMKHTVYMIMKHTVHIYDMKHYV